MDVHCHNLNRKYERLAKKVNRYFKTRNDIIRTEEELLSIIHGKDVLRKILSQ